MKPVTIYTLNRNTRLVGYDQMDIEFARFEGFEDVVPYAKNGNKPTEARVELQWIPIIEVVEAQAFPRLGLEPMYTSTYVAVEPELLKVLEVKHKQELQTQYNNLSVVIEELAQNCEKYSDRLCEWMLLPWYKRIWRAIKNDI